MLVITFHNDGTGTTEIGNYTVQAFINYREIYRGVLVGHERKDWRDLILQWAKQLEKEKNDTVST